MRNTLTSRLVAFGLGLSALVGFIPSAPAADYYVSNKGNDSNDGKTLQTAIPFKKVAGITLRGGDFVYFDEAETFNGTLSTSNSGEKGLPITFTSKGRAKIIAPAGAATIYLKDNSNIKFSRLELSAESGAGILLSGTGGGSRDIEITDLIIRNCGEDGINSANNGDARIEIKESIIENIQGCGLTFHASDFKVLNNTIQNTGLNPNPPWPMHGIYAKGPRPIINGNKVIDFQSTGISVRYDSNQVSSNNISANTRGERGICYFQETSTPGTTKIIGNNITGVTIQGIGIDNGSTTSKFGGDTSTASTSEDFVVWGNTIKMKQDPKFASDGVRLFKVPSATISNNHIEGSFKYALNCFRPTKAYNENDNFWQVSSFAKAFRWNEREMTLNEYRAASKQGARDTYGTQLKTVVPQTQTLPSPFTNKPAYALPGQPQNTSTNAPTVETPLQRLRRLQQLQQQRR